MNSVASAGNQARGTARQVTNSRTFDRLARFGLACRGALYALIGILALQIAFGGGGKEADKTGAVRTVAEQPFGTALLWLMAVGFVALALWQLSEAVLGTGLDAKHRAEAAGRTVVYALVVGTVLSFLLRGTTGSSTDEQSKDLTATVMEWPGGQLIVGAIGLGIMALGAYWIYQGVKKTFLKNLRTGEMSPRARNVVEKLGMVGYCARGVIALAAGVFFIRAAIVYDPDEAKGIDATLRSFADTPLGPWLLAVVAIGVVVFAAYCFCEARWRHT
ncbi:membrane protein [Sphaerisporangium krabiense]|uniref:DUF1206 domain-containing protein n=1 Tax=Sphaerisporangium krabiense TaxID=763782 RepID=A0A7W8ZC29_9ACTN|nr:DUF1206 domain-containing protein [Sphaerisporangium krabiense]MBB5631293.1 hypothetical protein [Sphaerisporangium krabiense]GII60710.1 membrane protein [Sphaerisporangium krabiense]